MVFNFTEDADVSTQFSPPASPSCTVCLPLGKSFTRANADVGRVAGGASLWFTGPAVEVSCQRPKTSSDDSNLKLFLLKLVVKLDVHDDKDRSKAMKVVSGFGGIGSLNMDMKDNKLTVSGDFDPVKVLNKLRKSWNTEMVSVEAAKKDDGKKDEGKKNEDQVANLVKAYQAYYSPPLAYYHVPDEETPNCVIC